jgi:hypothetical protein
MKLESFGVNTCIKKNVLLKKNVQFDFVAKLE